MHSPKFLLAAFCSCSLVLCEEHRASAIQLKPALPLELKLLQHAPLPFGEPWDMEVSPDTKRVYVANGRGGLVILDTSNTKKPIIISQYPTGGFQFQTLGREWILDHTREARAIRWVGGQIRLYTHSLGYDVDHWKELIFDLKNEKSAKLLSEEFVAAPPVRQETPRPPGFEEKEEDVKKGKPRFLRVISNRDAVFALSKATGLEIFEAGKANAAPRAAVTLAGIVCGLSLEQGNLTVVAGLWDLWSGKLRDSEELRLEPKVRVSGRSQTAFADSKHLGLLAAEKFGVTMRHSNDDNGRPCTEHFFPNSEIGAAVVSESLAYSGVQGSGLEILDVSRPSSPKLLGRFVPPLPPSMSAGPEDRERDTPLGVAVSGKTAYLANGRSGVFVVDVANPAEPRLKGHFWDAETGRMVASRMFIEGTTLYLCDRDNGIYVLDISGDGIPRKKALFHTSHPMGLCVDGDRMWVADGGYGLLCLDKRDGRLLAEYRDGKSPFLDVVVSGDRVLTAEGWRVGVYQVRSASRPRPSAAFSFHAKGDSKPLKTAAGKQIEPEEVPRLYGTEFTVKVDGVDVCCEAYSGTGMPLRPLPQDLSDAAGWPDVPIKPQTLAIDPKLGRFKFSEGRPVCSSKLVGVQKLHMAIPAQFRVKGSFAYFGAEEGLNLWIIDVSDGSNPRLAGNACTGGFTKSIDLEGRHGFTSNGMGQVTIYDLLDPAHPEVLSYLHIAGAYWPEADGQRLYVAGGGKVYTYDISDILHPKPLGKTLPGTRVVAEGGLVYLQNSGDLEVLDMADAERPKSLWKMQNVSHMAAHGRQLGVMAAGKWTLLEFTRPEEPREVQSIPSPQVDFDWDDGHLYIASGGDVLITSRATGKEVARILKVDRPVTLGFGGGVYGYLGVRVQGDRLYARDIKVGLVIFDIADRSSPKKLSEFLVLGGDFTGIAYDAGRRLAYTGNNWGGFHVIDLTNPARPALAAWHQMEGVCGPTLYENWLYAGNNNGGLCIIDVSDPVRAKLVGRFHTGLGRDPRLGGANFSVRRGNLLYLPHRCTILDVAGPANPRLVGRLEEQDLSYTLCIGGDYAYLGGSPHFKIVDIRDPARPKEVSRVTLGAYTQPGWGGYYFGRGIVYRGERVYVLNRAEFVVMDVSEKKAPRILSRVEFPGFCSDLDVLGDYAYIAGYYGGLHVLDISDPGHPMLVDHFQQGAYYDKAGWDNVACYQSVAVTPDHALLTEYYSGLMVVEIPTSTQAPRGQVTVECRQ